MKDLQIFDNDELGIVRIVMRKKEPWFVGKDIATALGYANTSKALKDNVADDDKGVTKVTTSGGDQETVIVNESGMYALVFGSRLEKAKKFKHWVTNEVLPSIRKTGKYETPKVSAEFTKTVAAAVSDVDATATAIEKLFKVEHGIALAHSVNLIESAYEIDLTSIKALVPPAEEEPGTLNPTKIGELLGMGNRAGAKVNKLLEAKGWQVKPNGKDWALTDAGREYGEMTPYSNHGHSGYQPRWRQCVVDLLRE